MHCYIVYHIDFDCDVVSSRYAYFSTQTQTSCFGTILVNRGTETCLLYVHMLIEDTVLGFGFLLLFDDVTVSPHTMLLYLLCSLPE